MKQGCLLIKTHSKGGAYSKGDAYWKEGAKSNHYGQLAFHSLFDKKYKNSMMVSSSASSPSSKVIYERDKEQIYFVVL